MPCPILLAGESDGIGMVGPLASPDVVVVFVVATPLTRVPISAALRNTSDEGAIRLAGNATELNGFAHGRIPIAK